MRAAQITPDPEGRAPHGTGLIIAGIATLIATCLIVWVAT
jgi:hypothetical protein